MEVNSIRSLIDLILDIISKVHISLSKNKMYTFLYYFLIVCPILILAGLVSLFIVNPLILSILLLLPFAVMGYYKIKNYFENKNKKKDYIDVEFKEKEST